MVRLKYKVKINYGNVQHKMDMARVSALKGAKDACNESAEYLRDEAAEIVNRVMNRNRERDMLVEGTVTRSPGGIFDGQTVGSAQDGRFVESSFISLVDAIKQCQIVGEGSSHRLQEIWIPTPAGMPMSFKLVGGNYVSASICRYSEINAKKKFMYRRSNGAEFWANPFAGKMMEAVEHGGAWGKWVVRPRGDNKLHVLSPNPGVRAFEMVKTVPPIRPFGKTIASNRTYVMNHVATTIKQRVLGNRVGAKGGADLSTGVGF